MAGMRRPKAEGCSAAGVDLSSKASTLTPRFTFKPVEEIGIPMIAFRTSHPLAVCLLAKEWLFNHFDSRVYGGKGILRMETQQCDKIQSGQSGTLVLLENVATVSSSGGSGSTVTKHETAGVVSEKGVEHQEGVIIGIVGVLMPKDPHIRWFYSIASFTSLLAKLDENGLIEIQQAWTPGTQQYRRLHTFFREAFLKAVLIPEHPDYLNAMQITDYAPDIRDPETALERMHRNEYVQHKDFIDLQDDRYLLHVHEAERDLAANVQLNCAEYLFVKRSFFRSFCMEVYRSDKEIKNGERVRTDYAHQQWLENELAEWIPTRARRLVKGWKELGLLDENWFMAWNKRGGMFATKDNRIEGEDKDEAVKDESEEGRAKIKDEETEDSPLL